MSATIAPAFDLSGPPLPQPRGPLSEVVLGALMRCRAEVRLPPVEPTDPLGDDDLHLALYACYELHYRGFAEVHADWEWDPGLLAARAELERVFERALRDAVSAPSAPPEELERTLRALVDDDDGPPLSRFLQREATLDQFREFMTHRSAYQLKEADPHSWAVPRLAGRAKEALVEVQADEYGGGRPGRMHATLFAASMRAVGLDPSYGAYLDRLPGTTLATVNLMSLFGLHRRLRGCIVGHLAAFEMTSPGPNRRYATGLRRLGAEAATEFFDEHVEADAVHEAVAAHDLAAGLALQEPALADDILFGAAALLHMEARFAEALLGAWVAGGTALLKDAV
jgi:heme oxygenase-like protein